MLLKSRSLLTARMFPISSWRGSFVVPAPLLHPTPRRRCRPRERPHVPTSSFAAQPLVGTAAGLGENGRSRARLVARSASQSTVAGIDETDAVPFTEYDYWATRPVTVLKRAVRIGAALTGWYVDGRLHKGGSVQELSDLRASTLRTMLTNLGPTFIKIGQAVSSRPDLVPPEYLRELEKLQDQIPPFSTDKALRVIREEYGQPPSAIFAEISPQPLAAASLGQVYKAILRSNGQPVAVKVQRPGVAASIALDVFILRQLAVVVKNWRKLNTDLPALLDGWAASLFKELDYRVEAANGKRFKELYGQMEDVFVPAMNLDLTTRKVLVMEWVEGERLRTAYSAVSADSRGRQGSTDDLRLVEVGVCCSLEQMLEVGWYHADPHPGNLLRTADGQLAYLDFGMMGQIDGNIRRALIRATLHLVNREFEALADDFIELGLLPEGSNREEIVPALTGVFEEALKGGVSNLSFGELSGNLGRTMYQFKFQIPSYYTLLVRSLSVLEGIALASDPNYKVLGAAYPWVARRLLTERNPELRATLRALLYKGGRFNFDRMESLMTQAVKPVGRRKAGAGAAGTQQQTQAQQQPRGDALALLLSQDGEFVRAIVTEELAKGIDAAWRVAADEAVGTAQKQMAELVRQEGAAPFPPPPFSDTLGRALLESLSLAPRLADEEDRYQVEGMIQLGKVLQETTAAEQQQPAGSSWFKEQQHGSQAGSGSGGPGTSGSFGLGGSTFCANPLEAAFSSLDTTAGVLRWVASEAESLGPAERTEALRLPVVVGQGVAERVVARVVRWLAFPPVASAGASSAGAADATARQAAGKEARQRAQVVRPPQAAATEPDLPLARPVAPDAAAGRTTAPGRGIVAPAENGARRGPAAARPAGGSSTNGKVKGSGGSTVRMRELSTSSSAGSMAR